MKRKGLLIVMMLTVVGITAIAGPATAAPGDKIWQDNTSDSSTDIHSDPTVVNGVLYIGNKNGTLSAFDVSDNTSSSLLWNYTSQYSTSAGTASPLYYDGKVYYGVHGTGGELVAFNATNGNEIWNFTHDGSTGNGYFGTGSPTISNGTLYITGVNWSSTSIKLFALDPQDGSMKWESDSIATSSGLDSSPTIVDGVVYVASSDGSLYAIDASDGSEKWNQSSWSAASLVSSPTYGNGRVYVGGESTDKVFAVDPSDGSILWNYSVGNTVLSSPTYKNGVVYIGSDDFSESVVAIDAATGTKKWALGTDGNVEISPTYANGNIYITDKSSKIYSINATDGTENWNRSHRAGVVSLESSPLVVNGTIYYGGSKGRVVGLEASDTSSYSSGTRVKYGTLGHNNQYNELSSTQNGGGSTATPTPTPTTATPTSTSTEIGGGDSSGSGAGGTTFTSLPVVGDVSQMQLILLVVALLTAVGGSVLYYRRSSEMYVE